jgi:uncharacterized delta-60 repeat protein
VSGGSPVIAVPSGGAFCTTRFTPGGQVDTTFGAGGTTVVPVTLSTSPSASAAVPGIAVDPGGRVVLGGWVDAGDARPTFAVVRLTPPGQPDATFSSDGIVTVGASPGGWSRAANLILSSGSPVLVGTAAPSGDGSLEVALVKLTRAGSLDGSFAGDGRLTTRFIR